MSELKGRKRLVLGVTGGIAAYKAAELVRLLGKAGADVHVVLTKAGARFRHRGDLSGAVRQPGVDRSVGSAHGQQHGAHRPDP
jgi:phosphopantothenoylcysteine synthetase/decarboxylase